MNNIMKKAILLISILMLFFTIYSIKNTFSLYESEKNILSETDIAKWEIKINENLLNLKTVTEGNKNEPSKEKYTNSQFMKDKQRLLMQLILLHINKLVGF